MTPETQRIVIAKACGLQPVEESGLSHFQLQLLDGLSSWHPQYILDGWVATHANNPEGIWLKGGCSQAVADKSIAEKWANDPLGGKPMVVKVKMLRNIPDYLNSLDAMHEAVMTLDRESLDYSQYCSYLNQIVAIENSRAKRRPIQSCDATAAQRAEAFLRCLSLWV